jgi:hypothetical protein
MEMKNRLELQIKRGKKSTTLTKDSFVVNVLDGVPQSNWEGNNQDM